MGKWDNFSQFNGEYAAKLNQAANSLNTGITEFEELPDGKYEVAPISLELTTSKKGYPMIKARFKVVVGEYKNRNIFVNQVVLTGGENDHYMLHNANTLLRGFDTGLEVSFTGLDDYDRLVNEVAKLCMAFEYLLEKTTKGGYSNYRIIERYELDDSPAF